ncbi:MAG: DUF1566 domain-containing protein, partial [Alphaproteobacteria bacterium]|nr:DUF1566 domain-containing protein [Alphaproteobacteria bacterium]
DDGKGWCWGTDTAGRLGNGAALTTVQTTPSPIAGGHKWKQISAGGEFTCGIRTDNAAMCWGSDDDGELGNGATTGNQPEPVLVTGGHQWSKISAGDTHACGIRMDGVAMCWGSDSNGRLGNGATGGTNAPGIVTGSHSWSEIAAGNGHSCGVTTAGVGYCWGEAADGKLGNSTTTPDAQNPSPVSGGHTWRTISAANAHSCGTLTDNTAYCWGNDGPGALGNGANPSSSSPSLVQGGHSFLDVRTGLNNTCGVTTGNVLYCWGTDDYGSLGTAGWDQISPTIVLGGHSWTRSEGGGFMNCGIRTDGEALCWGKANGGGLGNATTGPDQEQPVLVGAAANACTLGTWAGNAAAEANYWTGVAFGNGLFVAVAEDGTNRVMTSPDGVTWTARATPGDSTWQAVTYGNGLFVAVSYTGTHQVMTSPDGINWTPQTGIAGQWMDVTYGNGLFVATAWSPEGTIMTSPNGVNWTAQTASIARKWYSVTYGNGLFVAVAYQSPDANNIMTSPNGINWTTRTSIVLGGDGWHDVAYGNGRFVAVAATDLTTSTDGINWTPGTLPGGTWGWYDVSYGNGVFVAVSYGTTNLTGRSTNGIDWTTSASGGSSDWASIAYGNGRFVAVASDNATRTMTATCPANCANPTQPAGTLIYNNDDRVLQWCDGTNWHAAGTPDPGGGTGGCSLPNGVGGDVIFTSADNIVQYCDGDQWRGVGYKDSCTTPGQTCDDGSIYAGLSPDGGVKMYTTPADEGLFSWNDSSTNWTDLAMQNCVVTSPGTQNSCQTGEDNTDLLVGLGTSPTPAPYVAARHCDALVAHGKDDWYLPAQDELNVLWANRMAIGGFDLSGSFPAGVYWSSSEFDNVSAMNQAFNAGAQNPDAKRFELSVRCVRK